MTATIEDVTHQEPQDNGMKINTDVLFSCLRIIIIFLGYGKGAWLNTCF